MTRIGNSRLTATLGPLVEDLTFCVLGGDERTEEYRVEAVDRPQIVATTALVTPPAYTNLPPYELEQQTTFELVRGAALQLDVGLNKPVAGAEIVRDGGGTEQVEFVEPDALRVTWPTPVSGAYAFSLVDENGFEDLRPVRFSIQVVPDAAPVVRLNIANIGRTITPTARLRLEVECEDVFGIASLAALVAVDDAAPVERPFTGFVPGRRSFEGELAVDVGELSVTPGQRLRIVVEAADFDPHGPNVGRCNLVELRVVSADEFAEQLRQRRAGYAKRA